MGNAFSSACHTFTRTRWLTLIFAPKVVVDDRFWPILLKKSVLPDCPLKTPFLRAATRNLNLESSAQSKDFNLKRVLFCRGNHGRLFQQNRPIAALECLLWRHEYCEAHLDKFFVLVDRLQGAANVAGYLS